MMWKPSRIIPGPGPGVSWRKLLARIIVPNSPSAVGSEGQPSEGGGPVIKLKVSTKFSGNFQIIRGRCVKVAINTNIGSSSDIGFNVLQRLCNLTN